MSGCIHQAPAMYCGACASEKLEKALDLIERAQWAGTEDTPGCPWCGRVSRDAHAVDCPAARFMGWKRACPLARPSRGKD